MKQKRFLISLAVLAIGISVDAQTKDNVKTTFQTSREWKPSIDNRADAVMVYGVGGNPSDKSRKLSFEEPVLLGVNIRTILPDNGTGNGIWMRDKTHRLEIRYGTVTWCPISYRRRIF